MKSPGRSKMSKWELIDTITTEVFFPEVARGDTEGPRGMAAR